MNDAIDSAAARRSFSKAAARYAEHAVLQKEVETRLLESLVFFAGTPQTVLDLGAGPCSATAFLQKRWPEANTIALDLSHAMLQHGREEYVRVDCSFHAVIGDAQSLPLRAASIDVLFSNLCIQWCSALSETMREFARVLKPEGFLLFSTFGPKTLLELKRAWAGIDRLAHVHQFADLTQIGDLLLQNGFADPVVHHEFITLTYDSAQAVMRDLKAIGATNAATSRRRGLTGKSKMRSVEEAYERLRENGKLPATYEIIYAMAYAPKPGAKRRGEIASFPVERLRGSWKKSKP